jgi:aryl-alcohol dehydrogenase-like predicted oxidoreductase
MKIGLGTAQIGLDYGVSNATGAVSRAEAASIVRLAREAGIRTVDTAAAYGDAEAKLGELGLSGFEVVSKLHGVEPDLIGEALADSLERLRIGRLYGLLLHRSADLQGATGAALWKALERLKANGRIEKIGISVYGPSELDSLPQRVRPDLVQLPFSLVDRRMEKSGWLERLKDGGVEVHARSVLLQGLLLMDSQSRPTRFAKWNDLWNEYETWLEQSGLTGLGACLGFALANPLIDRVIVGTQSAEQLAQLLSVQPLKTLVPDAFANDDEELVNPAHWNSK